MGGTVLGGRSRIGSRGEYGRYWERNGVLPRGEARFRQDGMVGQ
jgi:hypothetical protein